MVVTKIAKKAHLIVQFFFVVSHCVLKGAKLDGMRIGATELLNFFKIMITWVERKVLVLQAPG